MLHNGIYRYCTSLCVTELAFGPPKLDGPRHLAFPPTHRASGMLPAPRAHRRRRARRPPRPPTILPCELPSSSHHHPSAPSSSKAHPSAPPPETATTPTTSKLNPCRTLDGRTRRTRGRGVRAPSASALAFLAALAAASCAPRTAYSSLGVAAAAVPASSSRCADLYGSPEGGWDVADFLCPSLLTGTGRQEQQRQRPAVVSPSPSPPTSASTLDDDDSNNKLLSFEHPAATSNPYKAAAASAEAPSSLPRLLAANNALVAQQRPVSSRKRALLTPPPAPPPQRRRRRSTSSSQSGGAPHDAHQQPNRKKRATAPQEQASASSIPTPTTTTSLASSTPVTTTGTFQGEDVADIDDADAETEDTSQFYNLSRRNIPDRYELGDDGRWHKVVLYSSCPRCKVRFTFGFFLSFTDISPCAFILTDCALSFYFIRRLFAVCLIWAPPPCVTHCTVRRH